jgi:hypothetical protein
MTPRSTPDDPDLAATFDEEDTPRALDHVPTDRLPSWEELPHRERTGPMPRLDVPGAFPVASEPMPRPETWHVTPTDIQDSEWGRKIEEKVNAAESRWKWTRRALTALGPVAVTSLAIALGWLRSSERAHGVAEEREAQRIEVRAGLLDLQQRVIPELRASLVAAAAELRALVSSNASAIARLAGAIDMLDRLGPPSPPRRRGTGTRP